MNKKMLIIILLGVLVMALWGSLYAVVKFEFRSFGFNSAENTFDILLFAGLRFLISGFLLFVGSVIFYRKQKPLVPIFTNKKRIIALVLVSLFAFALHYAFLYLGLRSVDSGKSSLIKQCGVIIFICFSFLFFKDDKFSVFKIIGAILGIGSIVIINLESLKEFSFSFDKVFIIIASFCLVTANVSYKKLSSDANPLIFISIAMFTGGLLLTIVGFAFGGKIPPLNIKTGLLLIYIIVATIVSYGIWYSIVNRAELSKLFIIKMVEPLFAVLVSLMIPELNTSLGYEVFISFALITLAIVVSNITIKKKPKEEISNESNAG